MTLLIPAFALVCAPPVLAIRLLGCHTTLPYHAPSWGDIPSFGVMLKPRYDVGARALDQ
jgi:hypothetical protein